MSLTKNFHPSGQREVKLEIRLSKKSTTILDSLILSTTEAEVEILSPIVQDVLDSYVDEVVKTKEKKEEKNNKKGYG